MVNDGWFRIEGLDRFKGFVIGFMEWWFFMTQTAIINLSMECRQILDILLLAAIISFVSISDLYLLLIEDLSLSQ